MYENTKSHVHLNGQFSDVFSIKVGVHQGDELSPLLFIIVMEALTRKLKVSSPCELLYTNDLVLMAEILENLKKKLTIWEGNAEGKGSVSTSIIQNLYAANTICQSSQIL